LSKRVCFEPGLDKQGSKLITTVTSTGFGATGGAKPGLKENNVSHKNGIENVTKRIHVATTQLRQLLNAVWKDNHAKSCQ